MDSIQIPQYIWLAPPGGFGFPAWRVFETCAEPTRHHIIRWKDLTVTIYSKVHPQYANVVCLEEREEGRQIIFAFRAFPDLSDVSLAELSPLAILERFVDKFGLTVHAGIVNKKLFLEAEVPKSKLLISGQPEGAAVWGEGPKEGFLLSASVREEPTVIRIALAFCVDIMAYWNWLHSH